MLHCNSVAVAAYEFSCNGRSARPAGRQAMHFLRSRQFGVGDHRPVRFAPNSESINLVEKGNRVPVDLRSTYLRCIEVGGGGETD
jgi:hypothetical protein